MNAFSPSLEVEGLLVTLPTLSAAANEEFASREPSAAGWDPYEVWRTRIKAAQDSHAACDAWCDNERNRIEASATIGVGLK